MTFTGSMLALLRSKTSRTVSSSSVSNSPPSLLAIVLIRLFFWVLVCECSLIKYFGVFWRCLCLRQGCFITCKSFPRLLALLSSSLSTKMAPKLSFQLWETFIAGLHNMLNGSWRIKQKANKAKPHVLRGQQQFLIACVKNIRLHSSGIYNCKRGHWGQPLAVKQPRKIGR